MYNIMNFVGNFYISSLHVQSPFPGGGIAYLDDSDSYDNKSDRLKGRGQTK